VDNLCHTLVGAAFGEAGLKRRAALGNLTLMLAANLPDVDALVFATDVPSVAFRRGWTHGILAQALLPVAFAALMWGIVRWRRGGGAARFGSLLLLSYAGVLSHVALDLLNNYGVRLLMPFSNRWFYGDAVFIVDPWLWIALGGGVWWARRRGHAGPARTGLIVATVYTLVLVTSARAARAVVLDAWRAQHGSAPRALMVGPEPANPFGRAVIVDDGDRYVTGRFAFPRHVTFDPDAVPKQDDHPAVLRAKATSERFQAVLIWARFPYYEIQPSASGSIVTLRDMRFGSRVGAATATVRDEP
jgi:inner membrane protein